MNKAVFLDRDGTIIVDKNYLNSRDGVELLPKAVEGLQLMTQKGYQLIVVSNQSGVARGLVQENNIHLIHERINELLQKYQIKINAFYYNTSLDDNNPDRKPNPGMLLKGLNDFNLKVENCWMIGDRDADILAGKNANLKTIYIENTKHNLPQGVLPWYKVKNLLEAAQLID